MSEYSAPAKFIDLVSQQALIRSDLDRAISKVLDHGQYIMGPEVIELESKLKEFTKSKNVISCANGTDAITICLMAWNVGPGDAVFVPSFTYIATAETPAQLGATPFFVDVNKDSFNMNPESFKTAIYEAKKMGLKPSVVIPVDLFGQPSEVIEINQISFNEGIKVLVDAAQSFGATVNNKRVGLFGNATTTSFFPAKPLGCYGDGGAILTEDDDLASEISSIRLHGKGSEKYDNVRIGVNSRLDTIQAAILIQKLRIFQEELNLRNNAAQKYENILGDLYETPSIRKGVTSSWAQYTLKVKNRSEFQRKLKEAGIPTGIYYPKPLHKQDGYSHFPSVSTGLETSANLSEVCVSLPMHPYLKEEYFELLKEVINN